MVFNVFLSLQTQRMERARAQERERERKKSENNEERWATNLMISVWISQVFKSSCFSLALSLSRLLLLRRLHRSQCIFIYFIFFFIIFDDRPKVWVSKFRDMIWFREKHEQPNCSTSNFQLNETWVSHAQTHARTHTITSVDDDEIFTIFVIF